MTEATYLDFSGQRLTSNSGDAVHSRLVYWVNRRFNQNPIVSGMVRLSFGFHPLPSSRLGYPGLNYIHDNVFGKESRQVLPRDTPGRKNNFVHILEPEITKAIEQQADVYLLGSKSGQMMHNMHMNQGNSSKFRDAERFQDGGLVIDIKDASQLIGIFQAFGNQLLHTDGHTIPSLFDKAAFPELFESTSRLTIGPPSPAGDSLSTGDIVKSTSTTP
ncbi:hypothetical protein BJX65DRAFT_304940 [Aspergillus insuetus]